MNNMTICIALIAAGSAFSLSGCDSSDDAPATGTTQSDTVRNTHATNSPDTGRSADNTGRNRDDLGRDDRTPMDQSQSSEHVELTAAIRRAVVADDTLSMGAKNCKIITDDSGRVWLRGVVDSRAERDLIERIARQVADSDVVTNELEVDDS